MKRTCSNCGNKDAVQLGGTLTVDNKLYNYCERCKDKTLAGKIRSVDKTPDGVYSGWNEGLDANISSKAEYKRIAKEKGLRPVDGW